MKFYISYHHTSLFLSLALSTNATPTTVANTGKFFFVVVRSLALPERNYENNALKFPL